MNNEIEKSEGTAASGEPDNLAKPSVDVREEAGLPENESDKGVVTDEFEFVDMNASAAPIDSDQPQNSDEPAEERTPPITPTLSADEAVSEQAVVETSVPPATLAAEAVSEDPMAVATSQDHLSAEPEEHEEEEEHEPEDFSHLSSQGLLEKFTEVLHWDDLKKADRVVKELKAVHDEHVSQEKQQALEKFLAAGGEEADFDFKGDDFSYRFEENYKLFREKKQKHFFSLEKQKEENYKRKTDVLEKLRHLVDGEENTTSINALKKIQDEWKSIGQVPGKFAKTVWANYNALLDRFYDNRSIYFELKELDRKKNLELKQELCDKAEKLAAQENIKEAVKELNLYHEEFKHLGPVPKEFQEEIWQRFKAASDLIYSRRREMVDVLKVELKGNMDLKVKLAEEAEEFTRFESDRINDWNKKTKDVLELQKKWEAVGGIPKEHAKKINKRFWGSFKTFFNNKSNFFKKLEGKRHENLAIKEDLVSKANELKDSEDWESAANQLKQLQNQWREVGPVPEKVKEEVFARFKAACDHFFERKRTQSKGAESEYFDNLKKKEEICDQLVKLAKAGKPDIDIVKGFQEQFAGIGFVPRNAIKSIQKRYQDALDALIQSAGGLSDEQKNKLKMAIQVSKIRNEPNADRKMYQKESNIRRAISTLENDIAVWRNNLEFLASSKKADKLKADFDEKIGLAEEELRGLKQQLKTLQETA